MKTIQMWRWQITDHNTGRRHTTRWRMAAEDALARDPHAQRVEDSLEVRQCPETAEEHRIGWTSAFLHPKEGLQLPASQN